MFRERPHNPAAGARFQNISREDEMIGSLMMRVGVVVLLVGMLLAS
jgi:hypothetical protein